MKQRIVLFLLSALMLCVSVTLPSLVWAQSSSATSSREEVYVRAKVVRPTVPITKEVGGEMRVLQETRVKILEGTAMGQEVNVVQEQDTRLSAFRTFQEGQRVVLTRVPVVEEGGQEYYISDVYRLPALGWIFALFVVLVLFFARGKGGMAVVGLGVSVLILVKGIVPLLLTGSDPLIVGFLGSMCIAVVSLYTAHGFEKRTTLAVVSTLLTLIIATGLAYFFVSATRLLGVGTEEAFYVQFGMLEQVNLRGLLLAGIIIGVLGVLDDITTGQTAAVEEIYRANPRVSVTELYRRGLSVGKEHIAALVNTLVLAYAGASLPLFLLFVTRNHAPVWVTLNSEFMAEEIVRTLVGSSALVLAVPITTFLAARVFARERSV